MTLPFGATAAKLLAVLALVSAQAPPVDRYQQLGNELGRIQESIGQIRSANTANAYELASAAQVYDAVLATSLPEFRAAGFEGLTPEAARQHAQHINQYVEVLLNDNAQLHAEAARAAEHEAQARQNQGVNYQQPQAPQAYQGQNARPGNLLAATGVPAFRNKAVVKDESSSVTTTASSATSTSTDTVNSKESKSESKESKSEAKSESRESKSESKSESKASKQSEHAAAANNTAPATGTAASASNNATTSRTKEPKSKNMAVSYGLSGGALVAGAVMALL